MSISGFKRKRAILVSSNAKESEPNDFDKIVKEKGKAYYAKRGTGPKLNTLEFPITMYVQRANSVIAIFKIKKILTYNELIKIPNYNDYRILNKDEQIINSPDAVYFELIESSILEKPISLTSLEYFNDSEKKVRPPQDFAYVVDMEDNSILIAKLTFKEAAIKILEDANEPLHYKEITKRAILNGLIHSDGKTPENSLLRDISEDIRINGDKSIFKKKSEGIYYIGKLYDNHFLAMGPWSNWEHSLNKKPILWGVKPDSSNTNIGVFNQLGLNDIVFLYVSKKKPSKFSKYGIFGVGKIVRKCSNEKTPYWPDEIQENRVIYTHRFEIEPIKIVENDEDVLLFDGLPCVKGLNAIKSVNPGLAPLLEAVENQWNVDFDTEKYYLIQNDLEYPVLRKTDIDKIFDINYARGITDYGRHDYVVLISSLAGIFEDKIDQEFITYTGEGQKDRGDQTLTGGNLAIIEAKKRGRKLYFLHELKNPNGGRTNDYEFLGEVEYITHEIIYEPSENRNVIRFKLKRISSPWNIQENNQFTGFDFVHENTYALPNNSKLISYEKIAGDYFFKGYGHVGNFEQEPCTSSSRNLLLPITSNIPPFCSDPILNVDEIVLKEKLEKIINDANYGLSGQKSIVLISILYWLSKTKFNESSLVEYLKSLNIKSDGPTITELELLVNNSKLFSDYVLIYKLYQSLGIMKFEIIDRIGYHIKHSLEMNNNSDRLISDFIKYDLDSELSKIEPSRAKVLLYNILKDYLVDHNDYEKVNIFWGGLYGHYHKIKCTDEILSEIKNMHEYAPNSSVIQINQSIYSKLMSQFSKIVETKPVENGKLRIPSKEEVRRGINEIQKELLISDSIIEEIVTHLASGRHVLLAGPVGTGKTKLSQLIPQKFWTEDCGYYGDVRTATADWTTQDVIGGISPKIVDNEKYNLTYEIENGCVTDTVLANYEKESRKSDNPIRHTSIHKVNNENKQFHGTWLVIDEFNRADIDKAFGQLFTALEYGELKIQDIRSEKTVRSIKIPEDYRIIGTLNTADKHYLFNLSDALKRRFAYIDVSIPERKDKEREIFLAAKNALKELDGDKLADIIKIEKDSDDFDSISSSLKEKLEFAYNALDLVRQFKHLGTAVLKLIYQNLITAEKIGLKNSFDNAINANLIPQLETLPKPTLRVLFEYLFSGSETKDEKTTYQGLVNFLNAEPQKEQYQVGFEAILRYLGFEKSQIDNYLTKYATGTVPDITDKITTMKESRKMEFSKESIFKKSLDEILKQSEF